MAEHVMRTPRRWELAFYATIRGIVLGLGKLLFRLEMSGTEHIPTTGPFILAPVHRSNLDSILAATLTRRRMRFMGKNSLWKISFLGRIWSALGAFPVNRGAADRAALRTCTEVIEMGEPLVMFPEGTRCSGPELQPLFDGPAFVACRTGIPIIPVGIGGSERAMPTGSKMIRPVKITYVVGPPLLPPARDDNGRVPRSAVKDLTASMVPVLQDLFDEAQRRAGTPNT